MQVICLALLLTIYEYLWTIYEYLWTIYEYLWTIYEFFGIFKNYLLNNTLLEIQIKSVLFFLLKNLVIWLVITFYLFREEIFVIVKIIQCLYIEICIYIFYLSSLRNTWLEDNKYLKIKMDTKQVTSIKKIMNICVQSKM